MKRILTYGWLLLTLLASLFVVSACQEDEIPHDTTEVMMTFTTRAVVTQNNESDAINIEKMNDIHVIVARQDGTVVYNGNPAVDTNNGTASVSFQTPVKTGGEDFKFFAIANENSLVNPPQNYTDINGLISHVVGDGNAIAIDKSIPQTKYWIHPVKQLLGETQYIRKTLDYLASKISVQFINNTNKAQSLSNIYITGITPNGKGRLFNHPTGEYDAEGEEIYEEVYVTTNDVNLNNGISFNEVTNLSVGASSSIQHYYSYPVDAANINTPTLYATWKGEQYNLPIKINDAFITELKRNDHLKIIVTLTGQELTVNYTIAEWEEHDTNIGGTSPIPEGGYDTEDWIADSNTDVVIGEEPEQGGGEEPEEPVEPGDVIWHKDSLSITPNYSTAPIEQPLTNDDLSYFVSGNILGIKYDIAEQNNGREIYIRSMQATGGYNDNSLNGDDVFSDEGYSELVLSEDNATAIKNDGGIEFWGNGVTITQIYIKEATTQ